MRQLISSFVEFVISHPLFLKYQGHRLRRSLHLLFKQLMQAQTARRRLLWRGVPCEQQSLLLGRREQRQRVFSAMPCSNVCSCSSIRAVVAASNCRWSYSSFNKRSESA